MGIAGAMRLLEIQIVGVDGIANTAKKNENSFVYTKNVSATRGEILDYSGNLIVGNTACKNIVLHKALFPEDNAEGNSTLLEIYKQLKEHGYEVEMNIPISMTKPYSFTSDETEELKQDLNLNVYATADNCIDKLISDYEIADTYTDDEKRIIAGLRYELTLRDFAYNNDFLLAEDVDSDTVIHMKELSNILRGVDAVDSAARKIVRGNILPHEIGTVGPIYAEEYETLKDEGYALNDVVGKSGIESAMEKELRGQFGSEEITVQDGSITDVKIITEAHAGESVKLTINGTYQLKLQKILDDFIANFQSINKNPKLKDVNCGAIVVLDTKTNAVKGMTTAPTYDLTQYIEDYNSIATAENSPLYNRATYGQYKPGSTFKTITATAGLNEGIIDGTTTFNCTRKKDFFGHTYRCTGHHNDIAVTRALEVSCNIFFYELSQRLTIDNITKYAELFGLGQHTGIETGDSAGFLATPEAFAERGEEWYVGYVLQAGIGNIDCGMTPLQMAVVASTIANNGVRYKPYLVDGLYSYGTDELVYKTQPTVAQQIELNYDYVFDYIEEGMIAASHNMPQRYSLSNLGFDVAIKTGTPQKGSGSEQNSFFIGYAPADDPEMAFAGVIENGDYSKYMIRDIILAYQECYGLAGVAPTAQLASVEGAATSDASGTATTTTTTTAIGANNNTADQSQTVTETSASSAQQTDAPAEPSSEAPSEPAIPPSNEPTAPPPEPADIDEPQATPAAN